MKTFSTQTKMIFAAITALSTLSAAPSFAITSEPGTVRVEIEMSAPAAASLSAPEKTEVPSALIRVYEAGQLTSSGDISLKTRGQTSLRKFPRKNLSVHAEKSEAGQKKKLNIAGLTGKNLILSAGPEDPLLSKNMTTYRLYAAAQIPSLKAHYAEVVLNQRSQGLYMVTESPDDYLIKTLNADIVIRRRYNDLFELKKTSSQLSTEEIMQYEKSIKDMHRTLSKLKGEALLSELTKRMNLDHYMRWLAMNFLLQNGDYSDEAFFFGMKNSQGEIYFDILPWDLDDTFKDKMHLASVPGHFNFGRKTRSQRQMLYSFEAGLDRAISQDAVLLRKYFDVMAQVTNEITPAIIDSVINEVQAELTPYLQDPEVLANGALDEPKQPHDPVMALADLETKRMFLKARLKTIQDEIQVIQAENQDRSKSISKLEVKLGRFIMKIGQTFSR